MKFKRTLAALLLPVLVGLGFSQATPQTPEPVTPCRIGQQAPAIGFWIWAEKARVKVYIVSTDFKADELPYLLKAFENWNKVSELTNSGVKFEYSGNTVQQLSCENCLTVLRGNVFDKKNRHATELRAVSVRRDQIITYAAITIDPKLTNHKAILDAVAHELGHNFGLLDCYTCKKKSTVMNQFKVINVPNDMAAPTPCDIARIREAYKELKVRVRPSPVSRNLLDEGEEPVDDDTPIVIPKP
jgi:hypothetical protein